MSGSYWKVAGENIAKGLGEKAIGRFGGRFLGRAGLVAGIGFLAYEFMKTYRKNMENEPAYKEMLILQYEMEKWANAISCIGREPFDLRAYGSFYDGGAINALYRKKVLSGEGVRAADPKEASSLIQRSVDYLLETENLLEDDRFEEKKQMLIARLERLKEQIKRAHDHGPIQQELARIVDEIRPIESGYASRIYDCSREIQQKVGSNAAWASLTTATLGLIKKPQA
jgi:hypothetical protein